MTAIEIHETDREFKDIRGSSRAVKPRHEGDRLLLPGDPNKHDASRAREVSQLLILASQALPNPARKKFGRIIFQETIKVFKDCSINDVEIINCCLKIFMNTFVKCKLKLTKKSLGILDTVLQSFADDCDIIIVRQITFGCHLLTLMVV